MSPPLIGVTLDSEPAGGWSRYPWYALRANYAEALAAAGALPMALPHLPTMAETMLDRIAGLVVTGGAFDVDPALYGAAERHGSVTLKQARTEAELALLRGALRRNMPVLGICGGQQLLAVALGGTLVQHIPDALAEPAGARTEKSAPRGQPRGRHRARYAPASDCRHRNFGGQFRAPPGGARCRTRHNQRDGARMA